MLFLDSSFYLIPALFGFVSIMTFGFLFLVATAGLLFLLGVNVPVILFAMASIVVGSAALLLALFISTIFFGPALLFTGVMFIFIPWVMWLSLPNSDSDGSFADYLKNVYSDEVINSDNLCTTG